MRGVILAAGRGSRMGWLSGDRPKCLTKIAGKELLLWQIEALRDAGVCDIVIVRGYKAKLLTPEKLGLPPSSFRCVDNDRWQETNMLASLLCAMPYSKDDDCIVSYSDIVYKPDHVKKLIACAYDIAITYDEDWQRLWALRFEDPLADAETFLQENGVLHTIGEKAASFDQIQGQYMGLIRISHAGCRMVEERCAALGERVAKMDMTSFLRHLLESGAEIGTVAVNGGWCEVDSAGDLEKYERRLHAGSWEHDWREA